MQKSWNLGASTRSGARWLIALAVLLLGAACTATIDGPSTGGPSPTGLGVAPGPTSNQLICQPGLTACNGVCVNLQSESNNCGSCGTACTAPAVCAGGSCNTACAAGYQKCGDSCVNVATDSAHCGSCDKLCDAGVPCSGGVCGCPDGVLLCQGQCYDPMSDSAHCGSCETACTGGAACIDGKCGTAQACADGKCECPAGKTACGTNCVDLSASPLHCGACATTCTAGQSCQAGQCKCAQATDIVCDNACTDPQTDINHCGDCATKCQGGLPCTDGKCACPDGETLCGGSCVSIDSTPAHCGGCDIACPTGESCGGGKCSGAFGDSCTSTAAVGISIASISVYQVGKIPIMADGKAVDKASRPADIIQGKAGRVRVFTKLESGWANRTVSARLVLANGDVKSNYFSKRNVTQDSTENSFGTTFNFDVKAEDFAADTSYSVQLVECDGTPAGMPGTARFPAADSQPLVTRKTGIIKVRFIPLNSAGHTAASDTTRLDAYKAYVALMYPTTGVEYTVGPALNLQLAVSAQGNGWGEALDQMSALHESDQAAADTYYYGLLQPTDTLAQYCGGGCVAGIGFVTNTQNSARHQRVALGLSYANATSAQTMAHEVGHNHGRPHSPCGGAAAPDQNFPYAGAKIGWWGFEAPEKLHNPATDTDIMGYCNNLWVSDYVYRFWTDRVAFINGAARELPPPGGMHHYLYLLTDVTGPRWGIERPAPRYPGGEPEQADILDASGNVIESVTVYRTPFDHLGGALLMVPDPEPGWHAIRIQGEVPLAFGASTSSQ